ncbi:Cytochrome P450 [Macleaya cordata]|uniref:Cytochrome P450 n=1 Tax=Macleaya cordata TaxID=56857 RepID=A0A200RC00_MACCD|nr:Cytochrome P450 [Macleaya cordata]
MNTLVVASADVAMELFKNHDHSFCNRHLNQTLKLGEAYTGAMGVRPYGPYWRMMRRLCATELFSKKSINETSIIRRQCIDKMIQWISEEAKESSKEMAGRVSSGIELGHFVYASFFNLMGNLLFSKDIMDPKSFIGNEFFRLTCELIEIVVKPNVADYFPWLRRLDPQNIKKKMEEKIGRSLDIVESFVKERRSMDVTQRRDNKEKDFWDVLMEFEGNGKDEPKKISDRNINLLIHELFMGSTETTSSTIEWAMTELLRNPEAMKKVRAEIAQVVGYDRKVEESDIKDLPYLRAVMKETLRLHPPIPFLIPRTVVEETEFMGYSIPKDTQVLVNAWGIGKDPASWNDAFSFKPDRFLGSNIDYHGQHFRLIPFGGGRRICPGIPLADPVIHLALGSLLQSFEWVLESGVTPETIDMGETMGITLRKAIPLRAIPRTSALSVMDINLTNDQMLVWTALSLAAAALIFLLGRSQRNTSRLPPGPPGWPVIGNILDLGSMPHKTLVEFQRKYGPLIWLRLGSVNTLVISSAESAMEMFKNHDHSTCNRHLNETLKIGERLCATELFSRKRIIDTAPLRRRCVDKLIKWISDEAKEQTGNGVELARFVFATSFNVIGNLMLSRDLVDPKSSKGNEFFNLTSELTELTGKPNLADFFPFLRWFDPQGLKKQTEEKQKQVLEIVGSFVQGRRRRDMDLQNQNNNNNNNNKEQKDFLDELFVAATETTNSTVEWAMTELLRKPEAMKKVRAEIAQVVGYERKMEESDIEDLHYLDAVIKETLRLHPPAPLLIPRNVMKDIELMGYLIPKDTQVFVNVWGLGRDPSSWEDASSFNPERFLAASNNLDYRGQNFEYLPFGAGRRICPGLPLGHQMLHLVLGSLLHSFEWSLESGVTPETLDMGDKMGTSLRKDIPLKAIPKPVLAYL